MEVSLSLQDNRLMPARFMTRLLALQLARSRAMSRGLQKRHLQLAELAELSRLSQMTPESGTFPQEGNHTHPSLSVSPFFTHRPLEP